MARDQPPTNQEGQVELKDVARNRDVSACTAQWFYQRGGQHITYQLRKARWHNQRHWRDARRRSANSASQRAGRSSPDALAGS